jgi:hypothetical protein
MRILRSPKAPEDLFFQSGVKVQTGQRLGELESRLENALLLKYSFVLSKINIIYSWKPTVFELKVQQITETTFYSRTENSHLLNSVSHLFSKEIFKTLKK